MPHVFCTDTYSWIHYVFCSYAATYKCGVPEKAGPVPLAFDLFMQIRPSKYIGERRSYDPVEGTFPVVTGFTVFL